MIIYRGYYLFRKAQGKIIKSRIRVSGLLYTFGESYLIQVKEDDILEEQIKTILHELAHLGLEGKNFDEIDPELTENFMFGRLSLEQKKLIVKIEEDVEKESGNFYERNPPLVDYIRKKLSSNHNKSFNL